MSLIDLIPERYKKGLTKISELNIEAYEALINKASTIPFTSSLVKLVDKIIPEDGLKEDDVNEIIFCVGSLMDYLEGENAVQEIITDLTTLSIKDKIIKPDTKEEFEKRLSTLLTNKQIFYASKSEDLLIENKNVFIQSKIVTDIRPIFGIDVETEPEAAVIIHNLHIHYEADAGEPHKDIYLYLDSVDIIELMDTLSRAQKKEAVLQYTLRKSGIKNLSE